MTLELRGSARPTLQQALRWIGSRVDDIYGASIGKLEDIWMDPDSGEPLWLLVRDGRIGGRHTLVPFAQAASGAGHVWIPFEREVVRGAPAVRPSAPLSHELSDTLRRYYADSGHPVGGSGRTEDSVRDVAGQQAAPPQPASAEGRREYTHAFANTAAAPSGAGQQAPRRPAPPAESAPARHEARPRQPWSAPAASAPQAPPEQPPLPPMPSRAPMPSSTQTRLHSRPAESFAAPRPQAPRQAAPRFEPPPAPPREPSRSDRTGPRQAASPPPAPQPAAAEELRITVGEGVDMELVGKLQFRGNIVRVQPLHQGTDA